MTAAPSPQRPNSSRGDLRYFAVVFAGCLLAILLVYGDVPMLFLRCESGEWLRVAHMPESGARRVAPRVLDETQFPWPLRALGL